MSYVHTLFGVCFVKSYNNKKNNTTVQCDDVMCLHNGSAKYMDNARLPSKEQNYIDIFIHFFGTKRGGFSLWQDK